MNAVVVLCHFCERDGPNIVMCTQPHRPCDGPDCSTDMSQLEMHDPVHYIPWNKVAAFTGTGSQGALCGAPFRRVVHCRACRSIPRDIPGFISNDHSAKTTYLSTQVPEERLIPMLNHACKRSLSVEVCPGKEGAIYFGDDGNGHVLSFTFTLADSQARGLQVRFSILVITRDKLFLLNAWPFLVSNIKRMVGRLQEAAQSVFNEDESKSSARATRLGSAELSSSNFMRTQKMGDTELRSLIDLTHDDQVFYRIHSWFTWLLKAAGRRWTEHILEGSPREDQLVSKERLEASGLGLDMQANDFDLPPPIEECEMTEEREEELRLIPVQNLRRIFKSLGNHRFLAVAYNVVVGNQIIIRSCEAQVGASVGASLSKLLPLGCVNKILDSREYKEPFKCNLLSVRTDIPLPADILESKADGIILLDIPQFSENDKEVFNNSGLLPSNMTVHLTKPPSTTPHLRFLDEIINALSKSNELPDSTLDLVLLSAREHWINHARILYGFKRIQAPNLPVEEVERHSHAILTSLQCSHEDESLVRFWTKGLSQHFKQNVCHVNVSTTSIEDH